MSAPSNPSISENVGNGAAPAMSASSAAAQACNTRRVATLRGPGKFPYSRSKHRSKPFGVRVVCSRNVATSRLSGQCANVRPGVASMRSSDTSS